MSWPQILPDLELVSCIHGRDKFARMYVCVYHASWQTIRTYVELTDEVYLVWSGPIHDKESKPFRRDQGNDTERAL
jgi:SUMO ligase MMS21 Smc5/6 complex component